VTLNGQIKLITIKIFVPPMPRIEQQVRIIAFGIASFFDFFNSKILKNLPNLKKGINQQQKINIYADRKCFYSAFQQFFFYLLSQIENKQKSLAYTA
jgi:hypothetical protein